MYQFFSNQLADTREFAYRLADLIQSGSVIALHGEIGAGKTTFVQSIAQALGVKEVVNSPTFTLIKEYEGKHFPLFHMDMYRINVEQALDLGLEEYFDGQGVTLIEWPLRIEPLLPVTYLDMVIHVDDHQSRTFTLTPIGQVYETWCTYLKQEGVLR